jgi:hypothetical protein
MNELPSSTSAASAQLSAQRLNNGVALIKSFGGGWHREPAVLAFIR